MFYENSCYIIYERYLEKVKLITFLWHERGLLLILSRKLLHGKCHYPTVDDSWSRNHKNKCGCHGLQILMLVVQVQIRDWINVIRIGCERSEIWDRTCHFWFCRILLNLTTNMSQKFHKTSLTSCWMIMMRITFMVKIIMWKSDTLCRNL